MEGVFMAEQLHAVLVSSSTMPSVRSGVARCHWSSGKVSCGVTNNDSLFGSLVGESGLGRCQENISCLTALCQL